MTKPRTPLQWHRLLEFVIQRSHSVQYRKIELPWEEKQKRFAYWENLHKRCLEEMGKPEPAREVVEALKLAYQTLKSASRQLTEEHKYTLGGKAWGQTTLEAIENALAQEEAHG
jgi:predicted YcjX-like family ATPase